MIGLIGKKIGMTQYYKEDGTLCPTTVIEVGPCPVVQVKAADGRDGYAAVKLGFGESDKVAKPVRGIAEKAGVAPVKCMHEFRVDNTGEYEVGSILTADLFAVGDKVMVTGTSKGRGFTSVIKRHGFSGGKDSHGCRSKRVPGSSGASASPSRVFKGKGMPGQYGNAKSSVKGLEVLKVDSEKNLVLIKGAVPGASRGIVYLTKQG
jgi:large subunit ribosomal protein L3